MSERRPWLVLGTARRGRGFSLLEVLVAFALMAVTLGVLFQVFSAGLRLAAQGEEYSLALRLAESRLAEASVAERLVPGETEGQSDFDGYRWRQRVEPHLWVGVGAPAGGEFDAFWVTVKVFWGQGRARSVSLTTLHLVPAR